MDKLKTYSSVKLNDVKIGSGFWTKYQEMVEENAIPYQWDALNDKIPGAEPSHAIENFRVAAGIHKGEFVGMVFQDSDVGKWLEAVGNVLMKTPNPELEKAADEVIDIIEKAQKEDGYLNTYYTIKEPGKRWTNLLDCHELYSAGHLMEAAVAYYNGTGKKKLLDIMCRFADHADTVFGREQGKLKGYCGHPEVELALFKVYKATGNEKYLKLAKFFIDERGQKPSFFIEEWEKRGRISHWTNTVGKEAPDLSYNQAHIPVREQSVAVGHAVRAVYLYTAMADIAAETGDSALLEACKKLWNNIVTKQMYISGGIGSTMHGEAFTFDYDLPNDTVYAETCAAIGLIYFAHRMLKIDMDNSYADVIERALYNNVLSGMAMDGKSFFYVNPLEVWPEACDKNPTKKHVKPVRQKWYTCACCPPNVIRLLSSLEEYIYSKGDNSVFINQYIGGDASIDLNGKNIKITQKTNYPWEGNVKIGISPEAPTEFTIGLRIPGWCEKAELSVNGEKTNLKDITHKGYASVKRLWKTGDILEFDMSMDINIIESNPKVRANAGKVAIQRGPLVYCLEEADNGSNLSAVAIDLSSLPKAEFSEKMLGGITLIKGKAVRTDETAWDRESLYRTLNIREKEIDFTAVPYAMWGNRASGEMQVWIRRR